MRRIWQLFPYSFCSIIKLFIRFFRVVSHLPLCLLNLPNGCVLELEQVVKKVGCMALFFMLLLYMMFCRRGLMRPARHINKTRSSPFLFRPIASCSKRRLRSIQSCLASVCIQRTSFFFRFHTLPFLVKTQQKANNLFSLTVNTNRRLEEA